MKNKLFTLLAVCVLTLSCVLPVAACGGTPEEPAHTHNYKWVDNGNGTHKQHCGNDGCDAPDINAGNHDFTNGDCVCGAKKPEVHTHNWSLTYVEEGDRHYQTCDGCTEKNTATITTARTAFACAGKKSP